MEWISALNESLNYLEEHLEGKTDIAQAAKLAGCSAFHYQRMFSYLAGMSLSEYLRRRKMSLAAERLHNGEKVLDTALRYGYDSPTAFNRAFQSVHGFAPSEAKKEGTMLKAFPRIRFQIMIKGEAELEYRIETKPAFRIVGIGETVGSTLEENTQKVPQMWTKAAMSGDVARLAQLIVPSEKHPTGILGVCSNTVGEEWKYYIAVASQAPLLEGMQEAIIPECTWAIFPGQGKMPEGITDLQRRIITEWLPSSGYEYADAPDIEVYLEPNPQNARYEVWLPIKKAAEAK